MTDTHLDHLAAMPGGLHVPYLGAHDERSPAAEISIDDRGRVQARRNPFTSDIMVLITWRDQRAWINADHLAHRDCDRCIHIWEARGTEHHLLPDPGAALFGLADLPVIAGGRDRVILHVGEVPATWLDNDLARP